jgi:HNH endonuclease
VGCDRPVQWCDAHHRVHWVDGGATSLDNVVPLCPHHHVNAHEDGWELVRDPATGRAILVPPARRDRGHQQQRPPPAA